MDFPNLAELIESGGQMVIGELRPIGCVATAHDGSQSLAMLVRNRGESLIELMSRLDEAVRSVVEDEVVVDEING